MGSDMKSSSSLDIAEVVARETGVARRFAAGSVSGSAFRFLLEATVVADEWG